MLNMFFESVRVDENVIDINNCEQVQVLEDCVVRIRLKRGGGIRKSERHH